MAESASKPPPLTAEHTQTSKSDSGQSSFFNLKRIAQLSGHITAIGASIYILGLLTVFLPIDRTYGTDFRTAWYIASAVPQVSVAGHGVMSLIRPALITIASTLLILMVLSAFIIASAGWRHAKSKRAELTRITAFMITIYGLLAIILIVPLIYVEKYSLRSQYVLDASNQDIRTTLSNLGLEHLYYAVWLACAFFLTLYMVILLSLIVRGLRFIRRLARTKTFPPISLKSLANSVSTSVAVKAVGFLFLTYIIIPFTAGLTAGLIMRLSGTLNSYSFDRTAAFVNSAGFFLLIVGVLTALPLFLSLLVFIGLLIWRMLRYAVDHTVKLVRARTLPSIPEGYFSNLCVCMWSKCKVVPTTLAYAMLLFTAFYLTLLSIIYYYNYVVDPLINEVRPEFRNDTHFDDLYHPLIILGAVVTAIFMYRKGLNYSKADFF